MAKKNKIRYTSKDKPKKLITLSGNVGLLYMDDGLIESPQKGDLGLFPKCEELHDKYLGMYDKTGLSGYFKVDVCDGKDWCPVVLAEVFPGREHYFSKKEKPIDCYALCREMLEAMQGQTLARTYREHYEHYEQKEEPKDDK